MATLAEVRPAILIVDDSEDSLRYMARVLSGIEAELVLADSGEAALRACEQRDFALILLDVVMPRLDGFEVARRLAAGSRTSHVPIVFVTAAAGDELSELRGYRVGAADYIVKPVEDRILQAKVRVFLDLYHGRRRLQRALDDGRRSARAWQDTRHDPNTGLPTPRLFRERLDGMVGRGAHRPYFGAVFIIEFPELIALERARGAGVGAPFAGAVTRRIAGALRGADTLTRLDRGEFAVLLDEAVSPDVIEQVARRLVERLREPMDVPATGHAPPAHKAPGVLIGYAVYPDDARDADALLGAADAALGAARLGGGDACRRAGRGPKRAGGWETVQRLLTR